MYGSSPQLQKAHNKMIAAEEQLADFEKRHPNEDELTSEEQQELKTLRKRAKNYRTRYEGDSVQEDHAEYVVGTRGRHEHHALNDDDDDDEDG